MLPEDFKRRIKNLLNDEYDDFIESYKKEKYRGIRVNTLKISVEDFKKICPFKLVDSVPWESRGFYIDEEKPGKSPYHSAGLYYVQEPSAMSPVPELDITKGQKVLDLCAAPGGKSTQAACYLGGEGFIVSNEIDGKRAKILSENIERMGIKNAVVLNNAPDRLTEFFPEYFDRIIVDAPCSGEGMFRKDEQAQSEWNEGEVYGCAARQKEILESADKMLKCGGRMIYSTCTFSLEENEMVIDDFVKNHSNYIIINIDKKFGFLPGFSGKVNNDGLSRAARLFPYKIKGEGHFMCLLEKQGVDNLKYKTIECNLSREDKKTMDEFMVQNIKNYVDNGTLYKVRDEVYSVPKDLCSVKGLKVLRCGMHIGTLKKGRFEPSHSFALCLNAGNVQRSVDFNADSPEILKYLEGNTLPVDIGDGWCLVCVGGYSIGWGKISKKVLKNHYPKGLRW